MHRIIESVVITTASSAIGGALAAYLVGRRIRDDIRQSTAGPLAAYRLGRDDERSVRRGLRVLR